MNSDSGFVIWWMDRPWWLRWLITFVPLGVAVTLLLTADRFYVWLWAIGGLMFLVNLFLSWSEILDALMGRRK